MRIDNNINTNEISIAKGIGIILMVVGHSGCPPFLRDYIYMFHMPLFFIISGYCFKNKYLSDFKTFANKRIIGLYFPFVKYGVLFVLLHNLFYRIGVFNADYGSGIASEFFNIKTIGTHIAQIFLLINHEQLISPVWFISALFVGYFLFYFTKRFLNNNILTGFVLLAITLVLVPAGHSSHPIVFRSAFAALYLWGGGILSLIYKNLNRWWIALICCIIVVIGSLFFATEMPKVNYDTFMPYLICSTSGTLMILIISNWLSTSRTIFSRLVGYLGDHTMAILIWHFTCFKIVSAIILSINDMPLLMVAKFPTVFDNDPNCYWPLYSLVGILIPLVMQKSFASIALYFKQMF